MLHLRNEASPTDILSFVGGGGLEGRLPRMLMQEGGVLMTS